jgi:hypothetical protein
VRGSDERPLSVLGQGLRVAAGALLLGAFLYEVWIVMYVFAR